MQCNAMQITNDQKSIAQRNNKKNSGDLIHDYYVDKQFLREQARHV